MKTVPMAPAGYGNRVEGLHAVAAAASAGRVRTIWVERRRADRPEIRSILAAATDAEVAMVDDVRPRAETDAPQGVVAQCSPIQPVRIDELTGPEAAIVILDHVEDPQNLGAVARSATAAGISGMVISSRRSAPLSATAFKAAAGALERLPVAVVGSIPEALSRLKSGGTWIVGLDSASSTELFGLELFTEPVALVLGAEGAGLSELASRRCDLLVSIPMAEGTESLNVSVSAALAAFEVMRVRQGRPQSAG